MYTTAYQDHLDELKITEEYFSKFDKENLTPENLEILFLTIVNFDRGIRDYDVLKKRENIETRGYDTNATITHHEYRKHEVTLEQENATETENPPVLINLHHDMQEYEQNLPEPEPEIEPLVGGVSNPDTETEPTIKTSE